MLKKRYLSGGQTCKVTFTLSPAMPAHSIGVAGEFNRWDPEATPMKQLKDGRWKAEVDLVAGQEYQYRYLINGSDWHTDQEADRYVTHPYGGENSVVVT